MNKQALVFILLLTIAVLALGGYEFTKQKRLSAQRAAEALSAEAEAENFVKALPGEAPEGEPTILATETPATVINASAAINRIKREEAEAFEGLWIHEGGWSGSVDNLTEEKTGWAMRLKYNSSSVPGQEFWVVVECDKKPEKVSVGDVILYGGKIDKIESVNAGPVPVFRIVIREGAVKQIVGK